MVKYNENETDLWKVENVINEESLSHFIGF